MSDKTEEDAATINQLSAGSWSGEMGLKILHASRDEVVAELEIRPIHLQPHGIVHGGVHCSIVESLASTGAAIDALAYGRTVVGLENHTSFVRASRQGTLRAIATPLTRGRRSQVWEVMIRDADQLLVASGRVRLLVLDPDSEVAGGKLKTPQL